MTSNIPVHSALTLIALIGPTILLAGCGDDVSSDDEVGDCEVQACNSDTGNPGFGEWAETEDDWSIAADEIVEIDDDVYGRKPGYNAVSCVDDEDCNPPVSLCTSTNIGMVCGDIAPHHDYLTAVHTVHMPTGEFLMFHGLHEERVWTIGEPAEDMRWLPIPHIVEYQICLPPGPCVNASGYPDVFCSGHSLLPDGRVLIAGGNVTNTGTGGGLVSLFSFDPRNAEPNTLPYGWTERPTVMAIDRWYPTLTSLPDGKVLISGGTSRVADGENTFELYDPIAENIDELGVTFTWGTMPTYPFMFVLPNGDVLYAGGEGASPVESEGRILVPGATANDWAWADTVIDSSTNGGSAVMFAPGKIMKSGGLAANAEAVDTTEVLDLSCHASNDYASELAWTVTEPMNQRRHFHTLTLLPDGRVSATGGNTRSNAAYGESSSNPCEVDDEPIKDMECGSECPLNYGYCFDHDNDDMTSNVCTHNQSQQCTASTECGNACSTSNDCPGGGTCTNDVCTKDNRGWATHCIAATDTCDPRNNACFATHTAELWEPSCYQWAESEAQERPRMYHSTAALLPDGRVFSSGGGHRGGLAEQHYTEYFEPTYGGSSPEFTLVDDDILDPDDDAVYLPYEGEVTLQGTNFSALNINKATLIKLSSVTHQFDQGQMIVPLEIDAAAPMFTVHGPSSAGNHIASAIAPPGYYMLFAITNSGAISTGQYVRVGDQPAGLWACPAETVLAPSETSCNGTPVSGVCPSTLISLTSVSVPVMNPTNGQTGWKIVTPAGFVEDLNAPTPAELEQIKARCVAACEQQWASSPEINANCQASGVFDTPELLDTGVYPTLDLIVPTQQDGSGIFSGSGQSVGCSLGDSCCQEFDESLCNATNHRPTEASHPLEGAAEYVVQLSGSTLEVPGTSGPQQIALEGQIGYGYCDSQSTGACPFYLDHLEASGPSLTGTNVLLSCEDQTYDIVTLSQVSFELVQPAFGIRASGSDAVGFPAGGLLFEVSGFVDSVPFTRRRPVHEVVTGEASGSTFSTSSFEFDIVVPCNDSKATLSASLTLESGAEVAEPPSVTLTSFSPLCGVPMTLYATVTDPDSDVASVRWRMDGVLLKSTVTTITPTGAHSLEVIARDSRGATTRKTTSLVCH